MLLLVSKTNESETVPDWRSTERIGVVDVSTTRAVLSVEFVVTAGRTAGIPVGSEPVGMSTRPSGNSESSTFPNPGARQGAFAPRKSRRVTWRSPRLHSAMVDWGCQVQSPCAIPRRALSYSFGRKSTASRALCSWLAKTRKYPVKAILRRRATACERFTSGRRKPLRAQRW